MMKHWKSLFALVLVIVMLASILSGCGQKNEPAPTDNPSTSDPAPANDAPAPDSDPPHPTPADLYQMSRSGWVPYLA